MYPKSCVHSYIVVKIKPCHHPITCIETTTAAAKVKQPQQQNKIDRTIAIKMESKIPKDGDDKEREENHIESDNKKKGNMVTTQALRKAKNKRTPTPENDPSLNNNNNVNQAISSLKKE